MGPAQLLRFGAKFAVRGQRTSETPILAAGYNVASPEFHAFRVDEVPFQALVYRRASIRRCDIGEATAVACGQMADHRDRGRGDRNGRERRAWNRRD